MKQILYNINMEHKETGEQLTIQVWAECADAATNKFAGVLFGYNEPYRWMGTGPAHKNNETIIREGRG